MHVLPTRAAGERQAPLHHVNPGSQTEPHAPALQVAVPFWGARHWKPQLPQLAGSELSATQMPAAPVQGVKPGLHARPQPPLALQVGWP